MVAGARIGVGVLALSLVLSSCALAAMVTYEGNLIPGNYEAMIPLTLNLDDGAGPISGEGVAMMPAQTAVRVGGYRVGSQCNLTLSLPSNRQAHLECECSRERLEGRYTQYNPGGSKVRGIVRLMARKAPEKSEDENKASAKSETEAPVKSATACLKLKIACLSACPRGEYNAEFLCANNCRRKEATCKGKGVKGLDRFQAPPPGASAPTPAPAVPEH